MISRDKPSYLSLSTPSQSRENTSKHGLILQLCAFGFDLSCISMMISYGSKQNNVIYRVLLINKDISGRWLAMRNTNANVTFSSFVFDTPT